MPKNATTKKNESIFINIEKFAARLDISLKKAREICRSRDLCDRGIAVNINHRPNAKYSLMRINWPKYLEYISGCPAVPDSKRVETRERRP